MHVFFLIRDQYIHTVLLRLVRQGFMMRVDWCYAYSVQPNSFSCGLKWEHLQFRVVNTFIGPRNRPWDKPNLSGGGRQSRIDEFLFKGRLKLFIVFIVFPIV